MRDVGREGEEGLTEGVDGIGAAGRIDNFIALC